MYLAKIKIRYHMLILLFVAHNIANSASYQIFPTLAYENPAALNSINKFTAIIGTTDIAVGMKYTGTISGIYGTASSNTNIFLPYLRLASRINPKLVTAFDISHPVLSNIAYTSSSFVSRLVTDDIIKDTNYSPKLSYQITDKIAVGLGVDINQISNAQINFVAQPSGIMFNQSSAWGYGWDTGLALQLNKSNFLNLSYYSEINFTHLAGVSQLGNLYRPDFSDNLIIPTTYTLNLVHKPTELWMLFETIRYIQWSQEQNLLLKNSVAGDLFFPLNYNDSWSLQIASRYQILEDWGLGVAAEYESSPQSVAFRPIALPATSITLLATSIEHTISKQWSAKLQYAYVFADPRINQAGPTPQNGHVKIGVNIVDFGVTWKT